MKLLSNFEATLPQRYKFDVVVSTLQRCREFDVTIHHCSNIVNTTSIVCCALSLLSNVAVRLEQGCNFDVVASTSLQRCLLVARLYKLNTICHNVMRLLGNSNNIIKLCKISRCLTDVKQNDPVQTHTQRRI